MRILLLELSADVTAEVKSERDLEAAGEGWPSLLLLLLLLAAAEEEDRDGSDFTAGAAAGVDAGAFGDTKLTIRGAVDPLGVFGRRIFFGGAVKRNETA